MQNCTDVVISDEIVKYAKVVLYVIPNINLET